MRRRRTADRYQQKRLLLLGNDSKYFLTHRLPLGLGARQAGYDVHVAAPEDQHSQRIRELGFQFHPVRISRFGKDPFREIFAILDLVRVYRRVRPRIAHHVTAKPVLYGTISARICRVPVVVNAVTGLGHLFISQTMLYQLLRGVVGSLYRLLFRRKGIFVLFQNEDDRGLFVANGWVRAENTGIIKGSGVDLSLFVPGARSIDAPPVVLFPARMMFTKGIRELVEAARQLKNRGIGARFVLAGDLERGNPGSVSLEWIEGHVEQGIVEYLGHVDEMVNVYAAADIVCLPSYREGTPKVLLEAAACGLPIVTTDAPGCRNVVHEGENGFLVPVGDSSLLAERLHLLIEDVPLREKMGRRSRELAADFSIESVVERTLAIYGSLGA